eukprot:4360425-Amphidinium_carterae.1
MAEAQNALLTIERLDEWYVSVADALSTHTMALAMAYVGSPSSHGIVPIGWTTYYQQDGKETSNPPWGDHFPPNGSFNHCYAASSTATIASSESATVLTGVSQE